MGFLTGKCNAETERISKARIVRLRYGGIGKIRHGTQIKTINGKCLYTHCYGHASNLAAITSVQCISDSLDTVREVGKLGKESPQRNTKEDKIRAEA